MATKRPTPTNQLDVPAWTPTYGWCKYHIPYRFRPVKERYRRLLALVFAVLISLMVGVFIVAIEPLNSGVKVFMGGAVVIIGMTLTALIFGIEINDVSVTKDGAVLNFGESEDSEADS